MIISLKFDQFEQMLSKKTADITRGTVQKAVCVPSNLPLYGHIQVKMGLIAEAYFCEGDFTQFMLLNDVYNNLNMCLNPDLLNSTQAHHWYYCSSLV
jgi:hypothetical protein